MCHVLIYDSECDLAWKMCMCTWKDCVCCHCWVEFWMSAVKLVDSVQVFYLYPYRWLMSTCIRFWEKGVNNCWLKLWVYLLFLEVLLVFVLCNLKLSYCYVPKYLGFLCSFVEVTFFILMKWPFVSPLKCFALKTPFSDINIDTLVFFWLMLAWHSALLLYSLFPSFCF